MITTLTQLRNTKRRIFVRWSKSLRLDTKRGYSLRSGTQAEAGLSCCEIDPTWEDWRIVRQLVEYRFVGGSCWIITGDVVGTGADNEPLLNNANLVGRVSDILLNVNWHRMQLESQVAADERGLARATDPIGRRIIAESLESNRRLLALEQ